MPGRRAPAARKRLAQPVRAGYVCFWRERPRCYTQHEMCRAYGTQLSCYTPDQRLRAGRMSGAPPVLGLAEFKLVRGAQAAKERFISRKARDGGEVLTARTPFGMR